MILKEKYNGIKFIFWAFLYILLKGNICFNKANPNSGKYKYIVNNNKIEVLEKLKNMIHKDSSQEFRQIFLDKISSYEKDRP